MKRLDRVILGDIVGPWLFGVVMFTVLIMAGQFLFQFTNYIVKGINPLWVAELVVLQLPSIMALTFPMAVLLACLLGFGRLSGDSEITAIRACGTSMLRIMAPVALFGLFVALLTLFFREVVVPGASKQAQAVQSQITSKLEGRTSQATFYPIYEKGVLKAAVVAKGFDIGQRLLQGVEILTYDKAGNINLLLSADSLKYQSEKEWKIDGNATVRALDGSYRINIKNGAWPVDIPNMDEVTPEDIAAGNTKNFDSQSMAQLASVIEKAKKLPTFDPAQLRNMQYIYWNKIAIPMAALIYALVGAPLGIRNHRTGAAAGFWIAILIIFAYFLLGNVLGIAANGGAISPALAAFAPILIGLMAGAYTIQLKNR